MNPIKIAILLSYICVASISAAIITPALPIIQANFHLQQSSLNWVVTLFLLGYMIGQLIYGPLANRFGRIAALRIGFITNLIGIIICIIASSQQNFAWLLIGRLITALGAAAGLSCTFILINELLTKEQAKQAISFAVVAFTLGVGLAIFIGGLITQYLTWSFMFWILLIHGILVLLSTGLFQETLQEKRSIHIAHIAKNYFKAFSNMKLVCFSLLYGSVAEFSYCYSTAAPMIAHDTLQLTPAQFGTWSTITMIGMFFGGLSAAKTLKHVATQKVLWVSVIMIFLGLISFMLQFTLHCHSSLWFFVTATYLYFFTGWLFPCASFFASTAIKDKASASSSMNFINIAAAVIGVTVMGYLPLTAFSAMIVAIAGFLAVAVSVNLLKQTRYIKDKNINNSRC